MKTKKKILAVAIAAIMILIALASVSLAYLQDTDYDQNTMTVGNVKIEQIEQQRDENGDLVPFADDKKLLPAVYYDNNLTTNGTVTFADNNTTQAIYDTTINNEVDKIVRVKNIGTEAAFIRTIILVENTNTNTILEKVHFLWNNSDGQEGKLLMNGNDQVQVTVNTVTYSIYVCTYNTELEKGATTAPSLVQIYLDKTTDNSWYQRTGEKFDILVLSQAVQSAGFENMGAAKALDTAFGEVNANNVTDWFTNAIERP